MADNIIVLPTNIVEGFRVERVKLVSGAATVNRSFVGDFLMRIFDFFRDMFGGNSASHSELMKKGLHAAISDMVEDASQLQGVNAVVDFSFRPQETANGKFTSFICTGTAARLTRLPDGETERELLKKLVAQQEAILKGTR
ncbi:MAG: hypothetical protein VR70_10980 [Rhodospirillaceae bacterium BRH_c57]|nr:MAG: hypothetical protein VR70_10980 [Rhodospirillaceae bacterium BRH_c57]